MIKARNFRSADSMVPVKAFAASSMLCSLKAKFSPVYSWYGF